MAIFNSKLLVYQRLFDLVVSFLLPTLRKITIYRNLPRNFALVLDRIGY